MTKQIQNEYKPSIIFPPGVTLNEELEAREMTPSELAERMGYPLKTIADIIAGNAEITPDMATQLERVLGVSATFWNNIERYYREVLTRQTGSAAIAA